MGEGDRRELGIEPWLLPGLARWFRLELVGLGGRDPSELLPRWEREPCIFVMNHTAIFGLEVYLLYAALRGVRPEAPRPRTTIWPKFFDVPLVGPFYRAAGCIPMSIDGASALLRAGESLLILPEGPDATDVRQEFGPFHAGFLRVVRALAGELDVPVVPLGWAGVDEANPWWVTEHPLLVKLLMKPSMPKFDFALLPRPPILRPSKVVFVAGDPIRFDRGELDAEDRLRSAVAHVRSEVIGLARQAAAIREERIEASAAERWIHGLTGSRRVSWRRD